MSRFVMLSFFSLFASGCVSENASPDVLPRGTETGVYTNRDPQTVAACIAAALGATPEVTEDRIVITSPQNSELRYSIGATKKNSTYTTQIAVFGQESDPEVTRRINSCVMTGAG